MEHITAISRINHCAHRQGLTTGCAPGDPATVQDAAKCTQDVDIVEFKRDEDKGWEVDLYNSK